MAISKKIRQQIFVLHKQGFPDNRVGNVVLCSGQANLIKNDQTLAELKLWMPDWYDRIQKFQGRL